MMIALAKQRGDTIDVSDTAEVSFGREQTKTERLRQVQTEVARREQISRQLRVEEQRRRRIELARRMREKCA